MKFCGSCGAVIVRNCGSCGAEVPAEFKFCGHCGAPQGDAAPQQVTNSSWSQGAERRQLTVMFCDMVGSTELASMLDPEELRAVVLAYQDAAGTAVRDFGGHIAQHLGDGLLVYFGYPSAHEDDPRRGVAAALAVLRAIESLNASYKKLPRPLDVRIGVHTGPVVTGAVGAGSTSQDLALGQTPNFAARLEGLAQPGTAVVSKATRDLAEKNFAYRSLGLHSLKGIAEPVEVFEVEHELQHRPDGNLFRDQPPMVGRETQLFKLREWLQQSHGRSGQVCLCLGPPGVGKSRLVDAFREIGEQEEARWLSTQCSPFRQMTALAPIIDLVTSTMGIQPEDTMLQRLAKVRRSLENVDLPTEEAVALFCNFLSIEGVDGIPAHHVPGPLVMQRTLELLRLALRQMSDQRTLLICVEDLHWADPSTLEFIGAMAQEGLARPIMLMLTSRTPVDLQAPQEALHTLELEQVGQEVAEQIVRGVSGGKTLPKEVLDLITYKTDGVPLFIEEFTKNLLESEFLTETDDTFELAVDIKSISIPSSLRDSLTERLDRQGASRQTAQYGAVVGREFSYRMLAAVWPDTAAHLLEHLEQLVSAELLVRVSNSEGGTYVFKHALIRDAAYELLLREKRQTLHREVAETLIERFPERVEVEPELVATHYSEARLPEAAIPFWVQSAQRAQSRSANVEAAQDCRHGLALLEQLEPGVERDRLEMSLQVPLGSSLVALQGFTAPEVEDTYRRALELSEGLRNAPNLFWVLMGIRTLYMVRGDMAEGARIGHRLINMGESLGDDDLTCIAKGHLGDTHFYSGKFIDSREMLEVGAQCGERGLGEYLDQYGLDFRVSQGSVHALCLWHLGYPDQAIELSEWILDRARKADHVHSMGVALAMAMVQVNFFRREHSQILPYVEEVRRLANERGGSQQWLNFSLMYEQWANFRLQLDASSDGRIDDTSRQRILQSMRHANEQYARTKAGLSRPIYAAIIIETMLALGRRQEALELADSWVSTVQEGGLHYVLAEMLRLKGEAHFALGEIDPAQQAYAHSLRVSDEQQIKMISLRTAVSSARALALEGDAAAARALLEPRYAWFTEGLESQDLTVASALLNTL